MKKVLFIDGHSILHRAYFGIPKLTNSQGVYTNAVYGFLNIMFKLLDSEQPDYLAVAFDEHGPTFRHEMFSDYKGTRKPMEDELRSQVPLIQKMLVAMDIPVVKQAGLEGDDILGTMAKRAEALGFSVTVVSGDRDLLQLATDTIKISIPKTKGGTTTVEDYYASDVLEAYSVTPEEFIDVKALQGDTADNIPGVPGIGEKTARALIAKYHSIDEVHAHLDELKPAQSRNMSEFWDQAVLSKELATICLDADIDFNIEDARIDNLYTPAAFELCRELEFRNLLSRFEVTSSNDEEADFCKVISSADFKKLAQSVASHKGICGFSYAAVKSKTDSADDGQLSLFDNTPDASACGYDIYAVSISYGDYTGVVYSSCGDANSEISSAELFDFVLTVSESHTFVCRNLKDALYVFDGLNRDNSKDIAIADYLLNPIKKTYPSCDIAKECMDMFIPSYEELVGKKDMITLWDDKRDELFKYLSYEAYTAANSYEILRSKLEECDCINLYDDLEMPLVFTLYDMEQEGIAMDSEALKQFGEQLLVRIGELEASVYELAGCEFNINSPKQLGEILFERLQLPGGKKTKTGYSTAANVLEKLAPEHKIVEQILEYRTLSKLNSTYVEGLRNVVSDDGRIHSTFQQTVTATGRLSSTEPNLQNIPIRLELGRQIRKVFYARDGYEFVDADYSQIELRVLAHMSGDENLIEAFNSGEDIHASTAARVFSVPISEVTPLQRRAAKAVNFGIVYGESAFGLSENLGISNTEAKQYINDYFKAYPKMKEFLDSLVSSAKETGYATTIFNRRRPIPELSDSNFMKRSFGERVAMNSPIQGSAADIIKVAMVSVHRRLLREGLKSRLILQIHDELLIEASDDELERVKVILSEEMQKAVSLSVPLEIDMHTARTWFEAK